MKTYLRGNGKGGVNKNPWVRVPQQDMKFVEKDRKMERQ
jgi:hypothetical protein